MECILSKTNTQFCITCGCELSKIEKEYCHFCPRPYAKKKGLRKKIGYPVDSLGRSRE